MSLALPSGRPRPANGRRFKAFRAVGALIMREMTTTYGRSPGGYLWAIMEPVAGIALLSAVFSLVARTPPLGVNFPMFYATGFLPFMMYTQLEGKISKSMKFSKSLLFYPSVTYADAILARFTLTFLTQMTVFFVLLSGIMLIWETRTAIDPWILMSGIGAAAIFGVGIGTMNCFVRAYFPVWERFWKVLNRPLFLISGIIFLFDDVPPFAQQYLWWNPLVHLIGQMRRAFYPQYRGEYVELLYPVGVGMALLVIGLIFLNRYNREILDQM
ncbi:ABC transporter permease [Sulfitobacter sp. D35]|uniref:ABC transporter permease n=1 Tax=Sulfitobacter sp. D35 TaxID=3083252 RepID=UPI00296F734C|nr:ABC transporter permease [Sulfitobacter sp. D35]MDW4498119.1 ABC transporter permease [Sulfitobacter sp. D35]